MRDLIGRFKRGGYMWLCLIRIGRMVLIGEV